MIAFSCTCGMKFKIKDEYAGRSSKCPTCKQAITVPQPEAAEGNVPQGQIDGAASSVHQAGVDGGVTLEEQRRAGDGPPSGQRSIRELLAKRARGDQRYVIESEIARGGMGAVLRAIDCDIRREVAVKYLLDQKDVKKKARFVEEAQITGQLEHPNIVPIHELGVDAKKRLFFSMKMVKGRSLKDVIDQLRDHPKQAEKEWSLTRLLNIFVSVCNGMAYAHSRGVVNRDCKPANIMIGDFGEVYVMDWGLAKALGERDTQLKAPLAVLATVADGSGIAAPAAVPVDGSGSSSGTGVSTSREPDADLTQEGAVVGTPVYMPPEQALGELGRIDQRSDIYSLGAMLYEMLTLVPPIDKAGGYLTILLRVSEGHIQPPEARAPQRLSRIPRELSAVAMKALAKEKEQRYQTVEALRQDIERFLEGRSVSAKEDTRKEMIWKLVKRNKGFSAASFLGFLVACVILFFSFKINYQARLRAEESQRKAEQNYTAYQKEQDEKRAQGKKAVPAFVDAARLSVERKNFEAAMAQVDVALGFDEDYADACLLKGQLLIARKDFAAARKQLEKYLKQKPADKDAALLVELCRSTTPNDTAGLTKFTEVFLRQKVAALAESFISSREKMLPIYQQRIDTAWPGLGPKLTMDKDGNLTLNLDNCKQVVQLDPLKGMPIHSLKLRYCVEIRDLSPLKEMPLTVLDLSYCAQVRDLTPLRDMKLDTLSVYACMGVKDLSPLQGMPITNLNLAGCVLVTSLAPLKGMPLMTLTLTSCTGITTFAPLQGMPLTTLVAGSVPKVQDLTPLRGLPLVDLDLSGCTAKDLTPLQGLPLTSLKLTSCQQLKDLSLLRGMKLTSLAVGSCTQLEDLTPLKGMPLTSLTMGSTQVKNLAPLQGMPLVSLSLDTCPQVNDLAPLKGMSLTSLSLTACGEIKDLTPLKGMPLTSLTFGGCEIKDLTPLSGMNLQTISFTPRLVKQNMDVLRRMKSLTTITVYQIKGYSPVEFWKRYDSGEFSK